MTWLFILALAVVAVIQHRRTEALSAQVRALTARLGVGPAEPTPEAAAPPVRYEEKPIRPAGEIPIAAKAADAPRQPRPEPDAAVLVSLKSEAPTAPPSTPRPAPSFTWAQASTWLAENGLAWLGGGGLALGGLLLVVYAAQRGVFTPPFRIAAAAILGLAMVAASEWIRRQTQAPGGRHALAAATAAGAGAVTLYGAVWAAHSLYGLIPLPLASVLAIAVSGGLLALALLHGEALALLALAGAFLAPSITGKWTPLTLDGYLVLLAATGAAVSGLRRWARAGLATLGGLVLWALVVMVTRSLDAAALLALALASPIAAVLWRRVREPAEPRTPDLFARQPLTALVTVSLAAFILWPTAHDGLDQQAALTALSALLVVTGAALVRRRWIAPLDFIAPVAATIAGLLTNLTYRQAFGGHDPATHIPPALMFGQVLGLAALIAGASLAAAWGASTAARTRLLAIGAIGAAVLANLAWPFLDHLPHVHTLGGVATGLTGLLLAAGAALIARRVEDLRRDAGLGLWVAAAAELAFLTVHTLTPNHAEPVAMAAAALALAAIASRLAWRGLAAAAAAGALVALATLLRPGFVLDATSGRLALPALALVAALTTAALAASARIVGAGRQDHRTEAEALSTAALLTLLTGLFLMLHAALARFGSPIAGSQPLLEASLRTALVLSAGLLLAQRGRPDDGPIARWRLIVVVTLGAAHGLLLGGLALHPWWGLGRMATGLPVLNDLLLTFLAPALLLAATARSRPDPADPWTRGWIAAAAVFALLWTVTAVRHAFHGPTMNTAEIGPAEACAYAVIALATAWAFRTERFAGSRGAWLRAAAPVVGWIALGAALLVFGWLASPWWGPSDTPMVSAGHVVLLLALYAAGAGAALALRRGHDALGRAALCVSVGVLFAFVTLLTRFAFHGVDMRQGLDRGGLETWTFSAVWTVFGLVVLFRASARKDVALRWLGLAVLLVTAGKVLLFDMATLDGVVRAASFLAVGALFIAGALVARRLNAGHKNGTDDSPAATEDDRSSAP